MMNAMKRIRFLIPALLVLVAIAALPSARALSVNGFSLNKTSYNPGDSGTATVTIFNDQSLTIRIVAVSVIFNYFYQSGLAYTQNFGVNGLSTNVTSNTNSQPVVVSFALPADVAPGYFIPSVQVTYDVILNTGNWSPDRNSNLDATKPLYIESPYKGQYQTVQTTQYLYIAVIAFFGILAGYFALRYYSLKSSPSRPSQSHDAQPRRNDVTP